MLFLMIVQEYQAYASYSLKIEYSATQLVLGLSQLEANEKFGLDSKIVEDLCWGLLEKSIESYLACQYYAFDGIDGVNQCHVNALMIYELACDRSLRSYIQRAYNDWYYSGKKQDVINYIFAHTDLYDEVSIKLQVMSLDLLLSTTVGMGSQKKFGISKLLNINLDECTELKKQLANGNSCLLTHAKRMLINHKLAFLEKKGRELAMPIIPRNKLIVKDGLNMPIYPKYLGMKLFMEIAQRYSIPLLLKIKMSDGTIILTTIIHDSIGCHWVWGATELAGSLDKSSCIIVIDAVTMLSLYELEKVLGLLNPGKVLLAIAADFMITDQDQYMYQKEGYSGLQESLEYAKVNGLRRSFKKSNICSYENLYIEHIYSDSCEHAFESVAHIFDNKKNLDELLGKLSTVRHEASEDHMLYMLHATRYMNR